MNTIQRKKLKGLSARVDETIHELEDILAAEEEKAENLPEAFAETERAEKLEEGIEELQELIETLEDVSARLFDFNA